MHHSAISLRVTKRYGNIFLPTFAYVGVVGGVNTAGARERDRCQAPFLSSRRFDALFARHSLEIDYGAAVRVRCFQMLLDNSIIHGRPSQ